MRVGQVVGIVQSWPKAARLLGCHRRNAAIIHPVIAARTVNCALGFAAREIGARDFHGSVGAFGRDL